MAHFNKLSNGSAKKDYCFKKLFVLERWDLH